MTSTEATCVPAGLEKWAPACCIHEIWSYRESGCNSPAEVAVLWHGRCAAIPSCRSCCGDFKASVAEWIATNPDCADGECKVCGGYMPSTMGGIQVVPL